MLLWATVSKVGLINIVTCICHCFYPDFSALLYTCWFWNSTKCLPQTKYFKKFPGNDTCDFVLRQYQLYSSCIYHTTVGNNSPICKLQPWQHNVTRQAQINTHGCIMQMRRTSCTTNMNYCQNNWIFVF